MLGFLKPVLYVVGLFLTGLGATMLVPGLVDVAKGDPDAEVFFISAAITVFLGSMFAITNRGDASRIEPRQAFVLTAAAWIVLPMFGALPFAFSSLDMSFADSYFEAMSGLTTTGATVIVGLDTAPDGILVWRALLHGMGGLGIVVMGVLILPFLKVGGAQLFRAESSDKSDRPFPRFTQVVTAISVVYLALLLLCAAALWLAGMSPFDSIMHALSAVPTGGFSTRDASIGYYQSLSIQWVIVVFMTAGAIPLTWHVRVLREGRRALTSDNQIWVFLTILGIASLLAALWLWATSATPAFQALTLATFNVVSVTTTTGFASADYTSWGHFPIALLFLLAFVGGCSGSTSGSIKVFRWELFFGGIRRLAIQNIQPNRVMPLHYNGQRVAPDTIFSVFSFILLFLVTFGAVTLAGAALGLDFVTAASGAIAMLGNMGPGLGEVIGPAGTYKPLSDEVKWLFSLAMLLGRLELLTVLVLLFPDFWRT